MRLTHDQRSAVVTLRREGHTNAEVRAHLLREFGISVSRTTIQNTLKRYRETGSVADRPGKGRPITCGVRARRVARRLAQKNRWDSLPKLAKTFGDSIGKCVSTSTVRRVLKSQGISRYIAKRKPFLTCRQRRARLAFAIAHKNWGVREWAKILFTDEKIFRIFSNQRGIHVTRKSSEKYTPACLVGTCKSGAQVHSWGAIGWHGCAPLKRVEGSLNAARYQEIVLNDIEQLGQRYAGRFATRRSNWTLMQDNAPAHSARSTRQFLANRNINILDWPGNSPDLNPIENVWGYVQARIPQVPFRRANDLWEAINESWADVPLCYVRTLIESLPERIAAVIKSKGHPTQY